MAEERIQKLMSEAGFCSRRKAEEYIKQGIVRVNGKPAHLGDKASRKDVITVGNQVVHQNRKIEKRYIMMYKPRGYVTTVSDDRGRKTVMDLLADVDERVYPVGRLDKNSEGLLILTNDGDLANRLMHPSRQVAKTYRLTVHPRATEEQITNMSEGVIIDGRRTENPSIVVKDEDPERTVMLVTIHEGRNREVRRMAEEAGLEVARLRRVNYGPLKLGMMRPGEYRDLLPDEVRALRMAAGEKSNSGSKKSH